MGSIITVNFRGDQLYGFENDDGVFVALKPIVESMGMDWSAQFRRVKRDPILSEGIATMATPFGRGGDQDAVCLKMDLVNGWLFTIDSSRIKDDAVRDKVMLYQRECYGVLFKHFYKGSRSDDHIVIEDHEETSTAEAAKVRLVTEARQTFGARPAGELWFKLGLPTVPSMIDQSRQYELLDYRAVKTVSDDTKAA